MPTTPPRRARPDRNGLPTNRRPERGREDHRGAERIEDVLAERTGQTRERIATDIERDHILRGEDAVEYGLVDGLIVHRDAPPVGAIR
ncbi:MAG: ATP-dependent Clp protease proteolytic subunit [Actinomycetia bacterium]|nr:ATP-dependent Clp protease proteolytic subunit [Actinomycetes bacterium]